MKYIVTGGADFIGPHFVEELSAGRHEFIIPDNFFSGKRENIAPFPGTDTISFVNGSSKRERVI